MKILSFDVGIKNLAYSYTSHIDKNTTNILDWGIINLSDCNNVKCYHPECLKPIKYVKNNVYTCKKHSSSHPEYCVNHTALSVNQIKKMSPDKIKEICKSYNLTEHKYKKHMLDELGNHFKTKCFTLYKKENANNVDLIKIGRNISLLFDKIFSNLDINLVLIENQIGSLATRMKTIQGMITQYFIIHYPSSNIKYISSFNKLKLFTDKKQTYKERKALSIKKTDELINDYNVPTKWIDFFNKHKKKDDLADCFLQSIVYMRLT
jgi:hypothetical protein